VAKEVDIPMPRTGLSKRLSDMHDWCHEHAHSDDRRDADGIRIDFCRFYFTDEATPRGSGANGCRERAATRFGCYPVLLRVWLGGFELD